MGAHLQNVCKRGHDMSKTRKQHPNGDSYCSECKVLRTKQRRKDNPIKNAEYQRKSNLRRLYGLEEHEYDSLFDKQNGKCGICKSAIERRSRFTHVDHDHKTGAIRGILCHNCNTGIGLFADNIKILISAIGYLMKSKPKGGKKK